MKSFYSITITLFLLLVSGAQSFAQISGISSGKIYSLTLKSTNKVLSVSNSSMESGANVNCWSNTNSDAQRWVVKHIGNSVYTFTNVASGLFLHAASAIVDSVNVNQCTNTNANDCKWLIIKTGKGLYAIKSVANDKLVLNANGGVADGVAVGLGQFSNTDDQKWTFQLEKPQAEAPTAAIADQLFSAWWTGYHIENSRGFWERAEMMEIILDAYEVTHDAKYITMFNTMYDKFIVSNGEDWMNNKFNDDIAWAVLFCVRGHLLTGNKSYLEKGKEQFDKMYARAATNIYGGGLNWYETKTSKNACINGPAMIACCYLAQATGDKTYYDKAIALYTWSKLYLFDVTTGKINDNIDLNKRTGRLRTSNWSSTYNQGTYLGAAVMLYKYTNEVSYLDEAEKIAQYIRNEMFNSKVIDTEDGGNDLPGFKGIFARYARMYAVELNKTDLNQWLQLNAKVAYNNRNSHDLIQTKWGTKTSEIKPRLGFGSSTAVSLMFNSLFTVSSK